MGDHTDHPYYILHSGVAVAITIATTTVLTAALIGAAINSASKRQLRRMMDKLAEGLPAKLGILPREQEERVPHPINLP